MLYDFGLGIPDMLEKISFFTGVSIMDFIAASINDDNYCTPRIIKSNCPTNKTFLVCFAHCVHIKHL
jgi:hypothetical protein